MSKSITSALSFPRQTRNTRSFGFQERPPVSFPTQEVIIDWDRLSDILASTTASFHDDGNDFGLLLRTLKQGAGLYSNPRPGLPDPDPELPVDVEVSEG